MLINLKIGSKKSILAKCLVGDYFTVDCFRSREGQISLKLTQDFFFNTFSLDGHHFMPSPNVADKVN